MPRKIAILNFKGGTGKTTTAVNLSHALALKRQRVLVVDLDPQGSISRWFGITPELTLYDLLSNKTNTFRAIHAARKNLDIIPSDKNLALAEIRLAKEGNTGEALKNKLATIKGYDFIFLDCPPSLSLLNVNALEYATEVFLPVSLDYLALIGVKQTVDGLPETTQVTKVIPTFYDQRTRKSKEILEDLKGFFQSKVSSPIRVNVRLAECASFHQTIFEYDPHSRGAIDYRKLGQEVLRG